MSRLSTEISRAERLEGELAVIILDVDWFKEINDSYGHAVGDDVLRAISQALLNSLRAYDMCVRFAGDEFVIVLGECPREAAELKRQELQQRVEEIVMTVDGTTLRVGASAGTAVYPHDGRSGDALLAAADRRMYSDKAARRRAIGGPTRAAEWESQPSTTSAAAPPSVSRPN
jgi:diguanylate cyclase (GGDEF)-like protein